MKRLTLVVSGNVQRAGYRERVVELGRDLGLKGYAENLLDGRVKIVAEGDEEKLKLLEEGAKIKNTLINVEKMESSFGKATGEFSGFFKLVREGETDERLDTAAGLLKELIEVTRNGFSDTVGAIKSVKADTSAILGKQDSMLEKQDSMLEKQDSMLEKQDSMLEKQDSMLGKQDSLIKITEKGFNDMNSGFRDMRDDFREIFMHEVSEIRSEIAEIKATLAHMQEA